MQPPTSAANCQRRNRRASSRSTQPHTAATPGQRKACSQAQLASCAFCGRTKTTRVKSTPHAANAGGYTCPWPSNTTIAPPACAACKAVFQASNDDPLPGLAANHSTSEPGRNPLSGSSESSGGQPVEISAAPGLRSEDSRLRMRFRSCWTVSNVVDAFGERGAVGERTAAERPTAGGPASDGLASDGAGDSTTADDTTAFARSTTSIRNLLRKTESL